MSTIPLLLTVTKGGPPLFALQRYLPEQLKERAHLWLGNDHELPVEPHEVGVITVQLEQIGTNRLAVDFLSERIDISSRNF